LLDRKAIHPNPRTDAAPSNGVQVDRNPPSLLWPASKGTNIRYSIRLSQSPRFPKQKTIAEAGLPWAMFTPSAELAPGDWYWQVGTTIRRKTTWSETYQFSSTANTRRTHLPPAEILLQKAASIRPRLMPTHRSVKRDRSAASQALAQRLYQETGHLIGQSLPDDATPPAQGNDEYKRMKFARWGSKRLAAGQVTAIESLLCAGLLNGDDRFTAEAVRRAMNIATWQPDGFTNPVISDFADASCMRAMALVYDGAYDRLSGQERRQLRVALTARCRRFFDDSINNVEVRLFGAHLWQHLLTEFFEGSLALLGDVPEARVWCRYIYELWVARFPLIAGDDGGWANGPKYFGTNVETLILMTRYFDQFGAPAFDDAPWFRNASKFLRYVWPPGSENDGFGDGTELESVPSEKHIHWVDYLGHRFKDRAAIAYAEDWRRLSSDGSSSPRLALLALSWKNPRPQTAKPEPKAILFRDTGLVSAHTHREKMDRNLNVAFRSCPYGSFNHMHSCQNAFNLFYGGERLFANSGYYIAMADEHATGWYRDTRGHNTILIDGKSQTRSPEGFGWIPRFIDGDQITYWAGDASNAYGDAGLLRYRRHVALLHPNIVVIYDDLAADHDAEWTWQLHAQRKLTYNRQQSIFKSSTESATGCLTFSSSANYSVNVGDTFDPPALNWGEKSYRGGKPKVFPKRWHAQATTRATTAARFLSIVCVDKKPLQVKSTMSGKISVGKWTITPGMDVAGSASLTIRRSGDETVLAVDKPSIEVCGKTYRPNDSSVLVENGRVTRSRDQLPAAAHALRASSA
jgi:hypothetical protein